MLAMKFRDLLQSIVRKAKLYSDLEWPGWTKALIWTASVLLFMGLCVYNLVPICDEYENNNKATQMDVTDNEYVRPNLTICIPYYSNALENIVDFVIRTQGHLNESYCEEYYAMERHGWNIWQDMQ